MIGILRTLSVVSVAAVLSGCVNLTAVRDYSLESASTVGNKEAVALYVTSEERLQSMLEEPRRNPAKLEERRAQVEAIQQISDVLKAYFESLAAVADGTVTDFSKSVGVVTRGVDKLQPGRFTADEIAAARSVGQALARLATDGARHRKLKSILVQANPDVQKLIGALREIVRSDIVATLDTEAAAVRNRYETLAKEAEAARVSPGLAVLLRDRQHDLAERRAREKSALEAYLVALEKISQGHEKLATAGSLSAKELAKQLKVHEAEIKAASKAISKL
jgi:hypothetical protein